MVKTNNKKNKMSYTTPFINTLQSLSVGPLQKSISLVVDIKILPPEETEPQPFFGIWLIDTSDSMEGDPFDCTIESLVDQISTLPDGTNFNLIGFGPIITYCQDITINSKAREEILNKLKEIKPDGTTPMYRALQTAFKILEAYNGPLKTKKIVLMSDGFPSGGCSESDTSERHFIEFMAFSHRARELNASIDTVGALDDHNVLLMYELAKNSAGKYIFAKSAQELKTKMTTNSIKTSNILFSQPSITVIPTLGELTVFDMVQYKPTIIRMPFEKIGAKSKTWIRSIEAGESYNIILKVNININNVKLLSLNEPIEVFKLNFDFGSKIETSKEIFLKFTNDNTKFRLNFALNRQYISVFDSAEEIGEATIKGEAEKTQFLQGDETKKI